MLRNIKNVFPCPGISIRHIGQAVNELSDTINAGSCCGTRSWSIKEQRNMEYQAFVFRFPVVGKADVRNRKKETL